jgi:hypothetical protein
MKRSSAVRHLAEMSDTASECLYLRDGPTGWPLVSMWAAGDLLGNAESIEAASVVLLLDLPADELPWMALNPTAEWVSERLRLGKRPVQWWYRSHAWPAWNPIHRRVVRFWSDRDGRDDEVLDALRARRGLPVVEPSSDDWHAQLSEELRLARHHLTAMLDHYYDQDWRRGHKGFGVYPEDHLWRAAQGVREIDDALARPV